MNVLGFGLKIKGIYLVGKNKCFVVIGVLYDYLSWYRYFPSGFGNHK